MKILVVDDDRGTLNALTAYLTSAGYQVVAAKDGYQALGALEASTQGAEAIDVMVTDLRMPGMTGLELIRRARGKKPELPSILMTAYGDDSIRWQAMALRAGRYLEKPFHPEDLLTRIEDAARWRGGA